MNANDTGPLIPEIDVSSGADGSDVWGFVLVVAASLVAIIYLFRKFAPARKTGCPGCAEGASCCAPEIATERDSETRHDQPGQHRRQGGGGPGRRRPFL